MPSGKILIRIATRESELALAQARCVGSMLLHHGCETELVGITTEGDKILDKPLTEIGGKGIFTKEIDAAVLDGRADISVHSLKDMPVGDEDGLILAAVPERESDRDIIVLNQPMKETEDDNWGTAHGREKKPQIPDDLAQVISPELTIGCGSPRRRAQLITFTNKLEPVRGNIQTRLKKMVENNWFGLVMAEAAFNRLNLNERYEYIPLDLFPAAGQGALGVRCLKSAGKIRELLALIEDKESRCRAEAERSFLKALGGGCHLAAGIRTAITGDMLHLEGAIFSDCGTEKKLAFISGFPENAEDLGRSLAGKLLDEK